MWKVGLNELVKHALTALRETVQSSTEGLTSQNCSISIIGLNTPFLLIEEDKLKPYVI
jgi:hypothetical protein